MLGMTGIPGYAQLDSFRYSLEYIDDLLDHFRIIFHYQNMLAVITLAAIILNCLVVLGLDRITGSCLEMGQLNPVSRQQGMP